MDTDTSQAIDDVRADLREVEASLRTELRTVTDDLRRHFDVVIESLRNDIRMIAEGVVALDAKFERRLPP